MQHEPRGREQKQEDDEGFAAGFAVHTAEGRGEAPRLQWGMKEAPFIAGVCDERGVRFLWSRRSGFYGVTVKLMGPKVEVRLAESVATVVMVWLPRLSEEADVTKK